MNILAEKFKEVTSSVIPIVILVVILSLSLVDIQAGLMARFLIGTLLVLIGLSIFLLGIDFSVEKIGYYLSNEVATSISLVKIAFLGFFMGFLITVAEPDLLILGEQVEGASGGSLAASLMVYIVSIGVGLMIMLGIFRIMKSRKLNIFMTLVYLIIFLLSLFVSEEFLAISFDASGATTGALTTPFVLALCAGLAKAKGGKTSEEDSFGLVGIMSTGPILALMLLSIITGQKNIQGQADQFVLNNGILENFISVTPHTLLESILALIPIVILFLLYNFTKFKLGKEEMISIFKGLLFTALGLAMFLIGVNGGFMDMGRVIGMQLGENHFNLLPLVGMLMGLIVVLAEPAVNVLGHQIEDVTVGHIPPRLIRMTLSIGVGLAITLSMVRIMIPQVKLWYFLLPGFLIAIILSYKSDPIFVGIAYDAGGVASGPMTATFILAFAQGAADVIPTANVLVDGFGVIAMVAMAPVLSLMVLGVLFQQKDKVRLNKLKKEEKILMEGRQTDLAPIWDCMLVEVEFGMADEAIDIARSAGAKGATVLHGVSCEDSSTILSFCIMPEKEVLVMIVELKASQNIIDSLMENLGLEKTDFMILPTEAQGLFNI